MVNIAFILSGETTERIPNLFTELVIIIHSYKAHNKLLILKEKKLSGSMKDLLKREELKRL